VVNSGVERVAHEAFLGLEDLLEHLDLSGNKLEAIPSAVLNLTRLLSLDVSRNRIRTMPHGAAFNNLNTLVRLDLANNRYRTI
jgi:Leucine-rich repeat (LRR) protein